MKVKPAKNVAMLDETDRRLIAAIQRGLPLVAAPYAEIGRQCDLDENEVIERLAALVEDGTIKRMGVVVRHRELGYRANAMVVWDIDDEQVGRIGRLFSQFDFVTLCYRRPRRLPDWPYNLFCMIHGKNRASVLERVTRLRDSCELHDVPHDILFSLRRFKQRGAIYLPDLPHQPAAQR